MNTEVSNSDEQYDLLPVLLIAIGVGIGILFLLAKRRPARLSFRQYRRNVMAGHVRAAAARRAVDGTFLPDSLLKGWAGIVK